MDLISIGEIAKSGMNLERSRIELASLRLAQANVAYASSKEAITAASGISETVFASSLIAQNKSAGSSSNDLLKTVHDPDHPLANSDGNVFFVNVDPAREMATLVSALRSYEANVRAFNINSDFNKAALSIGGQK